MLNNFIKQFQQTNAYQYLVNLHKILYIYFYKYYGLPNSFDQKCIYPYTTAQRQPKRNQCFENLRYRNIEYDEKIKITILVVDPIFID